jgi:hypothetical protein
MKVLERLKEIERKEGRRKLWNFVRMIAMKYQIALDVTPKWPNQIARWKMVLSMKSGEVIFGDPSEEQEDRDKFINKSIMIPHFRKAHIYRKNGVEYLRLGCIINKHLIDKKEFPGYQKLLKEYNENVERRWGKDYKIISMKEYMDQR